jgi:predicted alpha/beta-hydrolase family hydrolase
VNGLKLIKSGRYGDHAGPVLVLAHGAGAGADSEFMEALARALDGVGVASVRFEFPYMEQRRLDGRKRPPDRAPRLLARFRDVLAQVRQETGGHRPVLIGGKSMGGRMASLLAAESAQMDGVVCFGYPFHPPGRLDRWRTAHLPEVSCPMLVLQGTRDPFGKPEELTPHNVELGACELVWLAGGNHDFRPPARQGATQADLIADAARHTRDFLERHGLISR